MKLQRYRFVAVVAVLAFRLVACGGNPTGPSEGVTLEGTIVGSTFKTASVRSESSAVLTVAVAEDPAMTATIGGDRRFTLRGLPEGAFTLIFLSDGRQIGRLPFGDVAPNQSITVTVALTPTSVSLVSEHRNGGGQGGPQAPQPGPSASPGQACMINGGRVGDGIELEGRVASGAYPAFTMTVNGNRASGPVSVTGTTLRCNGPSTTPAVCQARLVPGARIHVRGTLTTCTTTAASVAADEVKIQN